MSTMVLEPISVAEIEYPETDGEPMAETDVHRKQMASKLIDPYEEYTRDNPEVYVSGNLCFYYEEGNPRSYTAPDFFVVKGVEDVDRRIYRLWEERVAPCVVIEITSKSTQNKDLGDKRFLYESLGIHEYFLFDPLGEYLSPPLQGFRLDGLFYTPLTPQRVASGEWKLFSEELNLSLQTINGALRFFTQDGQILRTLEEAEFEREQAEIEREQAELERRRAEDERDVAQSQLSDAEQEIERLRKMLEELTNK